MIVPSRPQSSQVLLEKSIIYMRILFTIMIQKTIAYTVHTILHMHGEASITKKVYTREIKISYS